MNKHVESLPQVDKSITFYYWTVICDVLRLINLQLKMSGMLFWNTLYKITCIFLKRQHKLYLFFAFQIFLKWTNLRLLVNVQKPKMFQLQEGFAPWPSDQGLCSWTPLKAPL